MLEKNAETQLVIIFALQFYNIYYEWQKTDQLS